MRWHSVLIRRLGAGLVVVAVLAGAGWWWAQRRAPEDVPAVAGGGGAALAAVPEPPPPPQPGPPDDEATAAVRRGGDLLLARPGPLRATLHDAAGVELAVAEGRTDGPVAIRLEGLTGTANPDGTITIEGITVPFAAPPFDGAGLVTLTRAGPAARTGDHYTVLVDGRPLEVWLGPSGRIVRLVSTDPDGVRMDMRLDE